jgi:hypothetical protein
MQKIDFFQNNILQQSFSKSVQGYLTPRGVYIKYNRIELRGKSYLRIGSVALGVDGCKLTTLLDADVQAPCREVVDEPELHLPLHRHRTVPGHVCYLYVQNAML